MPTGRVYAATESGLTKSEPRIKLAVEALRKGDVGLLGRSLRNDLQVPALALDDALRELRDRLEELMTACGAQWFALSGSGSSFFVITDGAREAERAARTLRSALSIPCEAIHSLPAWGSRLTQLVVRRAHH